MKSKSPTKKKALTVEQKALVRRYLIWAYKTTRESFERIERKTTQLVVDDYLVGQLLKSPSKQSRRVSEFKQYIANKRQDEIKLKYAGEGKAAFDPEYLYLKDRLDAIKQGITYFLGKNAIKGIEQLFEKEFTRRILESKEH